MIDRSIVGREYPPFSVEVEKRWVRSFAEAIGETDPIHFDEQAARSAGYRSLAAPLTFPFAAIMERNQSFMILDELGIDKRRTMHGEPHVPNDGRRGRGLKLKPGLVIAIEPWFLETTDEIFTDDDGWTLRSVDGSRGAHSEHTVAITTDGPLVLTARG